MKGVRVARRVGSELVAMARDRVTPDGAIPRRLADLTPPQLSGAIGRRVDSFDRIDGTEGTTDRARLALAGDGVPSSVFVKMAAGSTTVRLFGGLARLGVTECRFYEDVRPGLDIETPGVHGAVFDPATHRFLIVLEDLGARGCTFTEVGAPLDVGRVESVVDTLAALHAAYWRSSRLTSTGDLSWIATNSGDPLLPVIALAMRRLAKRLAASDPALVPADGRWLIDRYPAVATRLDDGAHTVLHGDAHPGNCYFTTDGRAGLLDWQVLRRGSPVRDLTYFLVLALEADRRGDVERALLDRYRDALAAGGGPRYSADQLWEQHRRMAAYPYAATVFTAGLGELQDDAIAFAGLRRAARAIEELDTTAALS